MAVASAQAADLPGKAAPAEYVRICDTYGAGFFFIPGTDTCLRIGGNVQVNYGVNTITGVRNPEAAVPVIGTNFDTNAGFGVRATLTFDARSNTEYGMLRSFTQATFFRQPLSAGVGSGAQINSGHSNSQRSSALALDRAFIQFAGFTFGHAASFFNFYQGDVQAGTPAFATTTTATNLLAYTASFGSGFSATIALEDGMFRRLGNGDAFAANLPALTAGATLNTPLSGLWGMTYAGQMIPDIVANLRVDQGWGSIQVMGALHYMRDRGNMGAAAPTWTSSGVGYGTATQTAGERWGWAVGAGLRLNLDMIARGNVLWLQGVYTDGALDYAFRVASQGGDRQTISGAGNLAQTGSLTTQLRDAVVNPATNRIATTQAWSLAAGFRHFWTPALRSSIFGAYSFINQPAISSLADVRYWYVGVNTIWSPVRNLDLSAEVAYHNINSRLQSGAVLGFGASAAGTNNVLNRTAEGAWVGVVRAQRNF